MIRSRATAPGLKHLAFFEVLAESKEHTHRYDATTAGLLVLRLLDHWKVAGPVMVEPESVSMKSVRDAVMRLEANDPSRELLLGVVNAMQTLREVDIPPILPRLFAYAGCLEQRAELTLAADVYGTIARLAEEAFDGDLLLESLLRLAYCQRTLGALSEAEVSYADVGRIAKRRKDVAGVMRAQIGIAVVALTRGNLPKADEVLAHVATESARAGCRPEHARALHVQATVAFRRGAVGGAVRLGYAALQLTEAPRERDLILNDIAAYLITTGRHAAAQDALMILEATAGSEIARLAARVNMVALGARAKDEGLFQSARTKIAVDALPAELRVNYLIESARGFRCFGNADVAARLLNEARDLATALQLNRSVFEVDEMLAERPTDVRATRGDTRVQDSDAAGDVEEALRAMAAAVA